MKGCGEWVAGRLSGCMSDRELLSERRAPQRSAARVQRRGKRFCRISLFWWIAQATSGGMIREDPVVCGVDISRAVFGRSMVTVAVVTDHRPLTTGH
jgi:hypothetical protein